jgi:hypothetical protein
MHISEPVAAHLLSNVALAAERSLARLTGIDE